MKKHNYPANENFAWRSSSPNPHNLPKHDSSSHKSPNPIRKTLETFNPLSPDNIEYLVNKRFGDSNSKETNPNTKVSFDSVVYVQPSKNYSGNSYNSNKSPYEYQETVLQENIYNNNNNNLAKTGNSRAYVNAMKALQIKIKSLEEENKELLMRNEGKERGKEEEFNRMINEMKEKAKMFEGLERNLKEKLSIVEKEKNEYERKMMNFQKENERTKNEIISLEKKFEDEFKNYLNEKSDLKAFLKLKEDKLEMSERENADLKEEIQDLRRGKQGMELEIMNGSDENQRSLKEYKEKLFSIEKERDDIIKEYKDNENELKRDLELERNEKISLEKEVKEFRLINEKLDSSLTDTKYQINQKENELLLLREKIKNLIKDKENLSAKLNDNKQIKKIDIHRVSEEVDQRESLEEDYKSKYSNYQKLYENPNMNSINIDENLTNIKKNPINNKTVNDEKLDQNYQVYTSKSRLKYTKNDLESIVGSIIQLEKELVKYIERYKFLSGRLTVISLINMFLN